MLAALSGVTGGLLALSLGVGHAVEPDHLAAVSTLVTTRRGPRQSFVYAASWGFGHAVVLLAVGAILYALKCAMPLRLALAFELGVAVMLVVLGIRGVMRRGHDHDHAHDANGKPIQPVLVGTMHGLAGSGALVAIAMAKSSSMLAGLGFLVVYGVGAMAGMSLLASAAGVPLSWLARHPRGSAALRAVTGVVCVVTGLGWGLPIVRTLF